MTNDEALAEEQLEMDFYFWLGDGQLKSLVDEEEMSARQGEYRQALDDWLNVRIK